MPEQPTRELPVGGPVEQPTVALPVAGRPGGRGRWGPFGGLAGRTVLVSCAVALIAVVVTALVAVPLARQAAIRQERQALGDQADTISAVLAPHLDQPVQQRRLAHQLGGHGVALALVQGGTTNASWVPARVVRLVAAGRAAHGTFFLRGRTWIVEGRSIDRTDSSGGSGDGETGQASGAGVVLAQPIVGVLPGQTVVRLAVALVAGGLAGVVAGVLLAQGVSRPVRRAAAVARRIGTGDRTARLPVVPPAELAELAGALNGLSTALADSENRQREFLLSVSHELRTPLTTIRGYGEALADGVLGSDDPAQVRHAGEMVVSESARLDRLIADLLALARLTAQDFPVELVDVDLAELAGTAVAAWRPRWCRCAPTRAGSGRCWTACWRTPSGWCRRAVRWWWRSPRGPAPVCWRCATAGRGCPTRTWRWRSSGAGCTRSTRVSGRSAPGWGWPWRPAWCTGWVAGSRPATRRRAARGSPCGCRRRHPPILTDLEHRPDAVIVRPGQSGRRVGERRPPHGLAHAWRTP
jgi:hypothetical protein